MEFSGSFKVDARLMKEWLTGIAAKYKQKYEDEVNASNLSPEHTSLEEISKKMEQADKLHNQIIQENVKSVQQDAPKAQEIRQLTLETLAETQNESLRRQHLKSQRN